MAQRGRSGGGAGAQLVAFLIVAAVVIAILKWLLITVAILIVPFGVWFFWDRAQQRSNATLPLVTAEEHQNTQEKLDAALNARDEWDLMLKARAEGDATAEALDDEAAKAYRQLSRIDRDGLPKR